MYNLVALFALSSVQWNPVNTVTNKPKKFGPINGWPYYRGGCKARFHCINEGFFFTRKCMAVLPGGQKSSLLAEVSHDDANEDCLVVRDLC